MASLVEVLFRHGLPELGIVQPLLDAVGHHVSLVLTLTAQTIALKREDEVNVIVCRVAHYLQDF